MFQLGIENLLRNPRLLSALKGKRVALLAHPASVDRELKHSVDLLARKIKLTSLFGPQHGIRGDKQDNMIETPDAREPKLGNIPVFSLYGKVRRPTADMLSTFDVILVDLQDIGCRIYTFVTTLLYVMEECAKSRKSVWVLDRPNPIGRPVDGLTLEDGFQSFVGAAKLPMRYGLTMGELAGYFKATFQLDLDLKVIPMSGYSTKKAPGFGWPVGALSWVNPSPNAQTLSMARCFPGTVMIEGTTLSEGRGTTRALEVVGAPDIDADLVLVEMQKLAPKWLGGCSIRPCHFEPTFHKHEKNLCSGIQIHVDHEAYAHEKFSAYRIVALYLKAVRRLYPDYKIWREFEYEYERDRLAFDLINGTDWLRLWIEDPKAKPSDLDARLKQDLTMWKKIQKKYFLYRS